MYNFDKGDFHSNPKRPYVYTQQIFSAEKTKIAQHGAFPDIEIAAKKKRSMKTWKSNRNEKYKLFKSFEFMIPGIMLFFVAMPGPFLIYMSNRQRIIMRVYQVILYVCFGMYECVRLREYIKDYIRNPTSLICFFHSCINTAIVPILYFHVAYHSGVLLPLMEKIESDNLKDRKGVGSTSRKNFKLYIFATTLLLLAFHFINVFRSIMEEEGANDGESRTLHVLYFIGKQAHHLVIQTLYCGLESFTVALMFALYMQFNELIAEVKTVKDIDEEKLTKIQKRYSAITDLYDAVQDFLSLLLFLFFFRTMFDFLSSLTFYSLQQGRIKKIWILIYEGTLTLSNIWQNTSISEMAQFLEMKMRDTLYVTSKIPGDEGATKVMLIFLQVFKDRPDPMYGCGVLRINRSLMFTMYGTTLTVVLMLAQMDPNLVHKLAIE